MSVPNVASPRADQDAFWRKATLLFRAGRGDLLKSAGPYGGTVVLSK